MSGLFGSNQLDTSAPVISSLKLQTSCYGRPKPWVFGTNRVPPNVIDYVDFTATPHASRQEAGKGGGSGPTNTTYTYTVATIMALCSGPIAGVGRVWADKDIVTMSGLRLDLYTGDRTQAPWPYMGSRHPDRALSYRDTAYVASGNFDLGENASFGNHSMEVIAMNTIGAKYPGSTVIDAEVADVVFSILTDQDQGLGFDPSTIDGLAQFRDFCLASGIWISPAYTEQKPASEYLRNLLDIGFADCVYSGGIFKIVPYSDVRMFNGLADYKPAIAPVYALTEDHFLGDGSSDAVTVKRRDQSECYNSIPVRFSDRGLDYNDNVATSQDQADIENSELRQKDIVELREIAEAGVAQKVADFIKHRSLGIRNEYEFKLPWNFALLEPMDVVTLTYPHRELNGVPVLIYQIDEDEDTGEFTVYAEDYPLGTNTPSLQAPPTVEGNIPNFAIEPGNATVPVLFEAPLQLTQNAPQIWMATAGGVDWGGADVWVSTDNASYQRVGRVQGPSRYGSISQPLGLGAAVDTLNVLSIDLSGSRGTVLGGTEDNARDLLTLSYVDGEYMAYANAALTGVNTYDLSYLVRGAYGTNVSEHRIGTPFVRLDEAVFKYTYPVSWLGKTIWVKLASYNKYGGGLQDLSKVSAHRYLIEGAPLGAVENLRMSGEWIGSDSTISWDLLEGADSYDIQIMAGTPVDLVRTVIAVSGNKFNYSAADMQSDGGPWRQLVFRVRGRAVTGKTGPWAQVLATNEQVGALDGIRVDVGYQSIVLKCARPADADYAGLLVWASKDPAFVPSVDNADFDAPGTMAFLGEAQGASLVQGETYYIHAAGYDDFGKDQLTLTPSIVVVIPKNVASEVADGVIKESNLTGELGAKIEYVSDLAEAFPEAAVAQLMAQQRNASGDKDALATTQLLALAKGDRENRVMAQLVTTVQTTVEGNTASVQQIMQSIDGTSANIFFKASVNKKVAGMAIGVNGDVSEVAFLADKFFVAANDDANASAMFTIITAKTTIGGLDVEPGVYVNAAFINAATIAQAIVGQAIIDSANIKDAAIGTAHIADAVITMAKISDTLASDNYVADVAGWKIWRNGNAEFRGVKITGDIKGGSININDKFVVDGDGNVTIKSAKTGARTEESGGLKVVYDVNGVMRMREGVW